MRDELPAIAKQSMRVFAAIEDAVTRFERRHRYLSGTDLRDAAKNVARCVQIAWREQHRKLQRIHELSTAVDALKLELRLAGVANAFRSKAELRMIAQLVSDLGRQVGGWLKAWHSKDQNARANLPPMQRVQTLSSRAAPQGANP